MPLSNELLESCFTKAAELKKSDTSLSSLLAFYRDCYISSTSLPVSCLGLSEEELEKIYSSSSEDNSIIVIPPGISHWPDLGHEFNKIHIKSRPGFHYSLFGESYEEEAEENEDLLNSKKRKSTLSTKVMKKKKKKDENEGDDVMGEDEEFAEDDFEEESAEHHVSEENNENVGELTKVKKVVLDEVDDIDRLIQAYIPPAFFDVRTEDEKREEDGWTNGNELSESISFFLDIEKDECEGELSDLFSALSGERQNLFKFFDNKLNNVKKIIIFLFNMQFFNHYLIFIRFLQSKKLTLKR